MTEGPVEGRRVEAIAAVPAGEPRIVVVPSAHDVATVAAHEVAETIERAVRERGLAHVALTGGSTAAGLYRALADDGRFHLTPWHKVHLWWGDDRFVPSDDPHSNALIAEHELLRSHEGAHRSRGAPGIDIPRPNVHPIPMDAAIAAAGDERTAAAAYAATLRELVPSGPDGWPVLDLVLLGIGSDGHLLSVFPDSAAFDASDWAIGVPAPTHIAPHVARVTLNPAVVPAARAILVMASGEGKSRVVAEVLASPGEPRRLPARLARRATATWILDEDAARALPDR